jgi:hypothetical protein
VSSLGFDLLDRHVVDGRGDDIACMDDSGALTFAQLLERSAALAGGLRAVGLSAGDEVAVLIGPGILRVQVVCACIRLGAIPGEEADVRIVEAADVVTVHTGQDEFDLSILLRAGKTDPAPSLPSDPPGYADAARSAYGPMIDTLLAGLVTQESTSG